MARLLPLLMTEAAPPRALMENDAYPSGTVMLCPAVELSRRQLVPMFLLQIVPHLVDWLHYYFTLSCALTSHLQHCSNYGSQNVIVTEKCVNYLCFIIINEDQCSRFCVVK